MSKPIPVMLDGPLLARIEALSQKMGEAKSTIMRIAMRVGLSSLEKTFEETPGALTKEALSRVVYPEHSSQFSVVEEGKSSSGMDIESTALREIERASKAGKKPPRKPKQ